MLNMTKQIQKELREAKGARVIENAYHKSRRAGCQKDLDTALRAFKVVGRETTRALARIDRRIAILRGRLSK